MIYTATTSKDYSGFLAVTNCIGLGVSNLQVNFIFLEIRKYCAEFLLIQLRI